MGGKAEVSQVVENEEVVLVLREGLHQRRHPEIEFGASIDVPGRRMDAIGLEESHEPQRRFARSRIPGRGRSGLGRSFHQVEEGEGHHGSGGASQEGTPIESRRFQQGRHESFVGKEASRNGRLFTTS